MIIILYTLGVKIFFLHFMVQACL